jgi:hypothetical protein
VDSDIVSDVSTNLQKRNRALSPRPGPRMCAACTNFSDAFGCLRCMLVRVMQAWERCTVHTCLRPSPIPVGPECTVFSSIISSITHACTTHACIPPSPLISFWTSKSLFPSGRPHLAPSPLSPLHSALVGLTAFLASVTREQQMVFFERT